MELVAKVAVIKIVLMVFEKALAFSHRLWEQKVTGSVKQLVLKKSFRMSPATNHNFSGGELNNIINVDCGTIQNNVSQIFELVKQPFEMIYCVWYLKAMYGKSLIAGVALFLLS